MVKDTSWQESSKWYQKHMKEGGSYNHQELILPKLLPMLDLQPGDSLLDLGCGQGILGRSISPKNNYLGIDSSRSLLQFAKKNDASKSHQYLIKDVTEPLKLEDTYTHAAFILSLQNMLHPQKALLEASKALVDHGKLFLVINHPCFRIPKYSSWEFLENHQGQYRRIDRYYNSFKSSIQTHPSKGKDSPVTWSFHHPLSSYFKFLKEAGFLVEDLIEICSNRKSYGKAARSENLARKEFPLFVILSAIKRRSFD